MAISKEVKEEVTKDLQAAVTNYFAATMGIDPSVIESFILEQGYPKLEYEREIYADKLRIEINMTRHPQ